MPRPAGVPDDADLVAAGATIGRITIDVGNIFDESDPRENTGLYALADRLHVRTREATIRAQLLFASGEPYVPRKLAESERNLRLLSYIYEPHVFPVAYHDGVVDILVRTHDVWTFSPGIDFGRAGGTNSTNINIKDANFLGLGKNLGIADLHTVDRSSKQLLWSDPNVFGSRWISAGTLVDSSDGRQRSLQLARPFYELDAPWSLNALGSHYQRTVSRYDRGMIVDQFNDDQLSYELGGGVSRGLRQGWVLRYLGGMRFDRNDFAPTPGSAMPAAVLPADRRLSYPFVGFDLLQDDYRKQGDQNQIGRTEDFYLGTEVSGEFGWINPTFGADRRALNVAARAREGFELTPLQLLLLSATFNSRFESGHARNLIASAVANYYWRWRPNWLLYSSLAATTTVALDADTQVLLGGDTGLRGYPLRYESGSSRGLLTVEQRYYSDWYPFRLVRVGAAVFADVGRTWGAGVIGSGSPGMLSDAGFGLRLGNTRTGLGNVLHIDLAVPLTSQPGISRVQLLIQTQQSF